MWAAIERLVEQVQNRAIGVVELFLRCTDRTLRSMIRGARIASHRSHTVPVDRDRIARGARLWGVAAPITPAELELLETIVMSYLLSLRMEHVAVPVPDLAMAGTLALLYYFLKRSECRRQV